VGLLHEDAFWSRSEPLLPVLLGRREKFSDVLDLVKPVAVKKEKHSEQVFVPVTPPPTAKCIVQEVRDALEQRICADAADADAALRAEALEDTSSLGAYHLRALRQRFDRFCLPGVQTLSEDDFWRLVTAVDESFTREASTAFFHAFSTPTSSQPSQRQSLASWAVHAEARHGGVVTPSIANDLAIVHAASTQVVDRQLTFSEFTRGVCAADPHDAMSMYAKAPYFSRFFAVAPKLCFRFEISLLRVRWTDLRSAFLVAKRGGSDFICLHELYMDCPELFRLVCEFL